MYKRTQVILGLAIGQVRDSCASGHHSKSHLQRGVFKSEKKIEFEYGCCLTKVRTQIPMNK